MLTLNFRSCMSEKVKLKFCPLTKRSAFCAASDKYFAYICSYDRKNDPIFNADNIDL